MDVCLYRQPHESISTTGNDTSTYSATWQYNPLVKSNRISGLSPQEHLERCRKLAALDYRPIVVSVAGCDNSQDVLSASVWQAWKLTEEDEDTLAKRRANAAIALLHLGHAEFVWPLLRHQPDSRVRTYLIHSFCPLGVDARILIARLSEETDVSARRALLLAIGEYDDGEKFAADRDQLISRLLETYRRDPDPGIHAAVGWLLRNHWNQGAALDAIDRDLAGTPRDGKRWCLNSHGDTFVLIPGPVEFIMGAPSPFRERTGQAYPLHPKRINRSFAIATREVTMAQLREFLKHHPDADGPIVPLSPDDRCPANHVSWYVAAQYCRWLSEKEDVPETEQCFPPIDEIETYKREERIVPLPADYLRRTGYRLPTRAEWEFASRAGATTLRPYGNDPTLLDGYAWYMANAKDRTWPGGRLKPNDLGLFDCLGNVWEWCQEPRVVAHKTSPTDEEEFLPNHVRDPEYIARGGSFYYHSTFTTAAASYFVRLKRNSDSTIGFRIARTIPADSR